MNNEHFTDIHAKGKWVVMVSMRTTIKFQCIPWLVYLMARTLSIYSTDRLSAARM